MLTDRRDALPRFVTARQTRRGAGAMMLRLSLGLVGLSQGAAGAFRPFARIAMHKDNPTQAPVVPRDRIPH